MIPLACRAFLLLVVVALSIPGAARADDAAALYDPASVFQVDLTLSDDSKQALLDDPSTYVPATFQLSGDDLAFGPSAVTVKLKGHGSFRPLGEKAAFKVKFAKSDRLLGLKTLTLNNMVQDDSMIHEGLGYEVLRAAGVPAPRTGFAYVRVNGEGYGLYLNLETYDDVSLERLFDTTQHLYEADDYGVDVVPGGAGAYEVEEGDDEDLSDLEALITATNATGGGWSEGMAATADLDAMTRMWAGEQYIGQTDGYSVTPGPFHPNNYYLHSDEAGLFTMLASGLDQAYVERVPLPGNGDGLLVEHCRSDSSCLQAFRANLGVVAAAADGLSIGARLDAIATTVARWRPCPNLEQADDVAWQSAVTATRAFIRDRRTEVATYIGAPAPVSDPLLDSTVPPVLSASGCPRMPEPPPEEADPPPDRQAQTSPATASGNVAGATARSPRLLPRRFTARVTPGTDARPPYRITTSGSLLLPAGLGRASACHGRVAVRIKAGARTVSLRRARLRSNCTFSLSVTFRSPSRIGGRRELTVRARFEGNDTLLPRSAATRTVAVSSDR